MIPAIGGMNESSQVPLSGQQNNHNSDAHSSSNSRPAVEVNISTTAKNMLDLENIFTALLLALLAKEDKEDKESNIAGALAISAALIATFDQFCDCLSSKIVNGEIVIGINNIDKVEIAINNQDVGSLLGDGGLATMAAAAPAI